MCSGTWTHQVQRNIRISRLLTFSSNIKFYFPSLLYLPPVIFLSSFLCLFIYLSISCFLNTPSTYASTADSSQRPSFKSSDGPNRHSFSTKSGDSRKDRFDTAHAHKLFTATGIGIGMFYSTKRLTVSMLLSKKFVSVFFLSIIRNTKS